MPVLTCGGIRHTGELSKVERRTATTAGATFPARHQAAGQAGRRSTALAVGTAQNGLLKALVKLEILFKEKTKMKRKMKEDKKCEVKRC